MNQTLTIDGETYQVDRTVVGAIDEMQTEIETLRNALVRLAVFIGGNPCWCQCEGGKHSKVCGTFWHYDLVTATTPRRKLKSSQYLSSLYAWAAQNGWIITPFAPPPIKPDKERG